MDLSEGQRRVLNLVAEKSNRSVNTPVFDTAIVDASGMPGDEVHRYLTQLDGLGLVTVGLKVSGADFGLVNITKEGLDASSEKQQDR